MAKVTNVSPGPRGLHTSTGLVFVDPWQTWEGEIDDKALKSALDTGWFAKGEKKAPGDEGDSEEVVGLKRALAERDQQIAELRTKLEAAETAAASADKGSTAPKTPAEVLAMAEDGTQFMTFKAEAEKLLGEKTPAKKVDIVAALEELATNP